MVPVRLSNSEPLFVGGTRRVFQHPDHADRCIKVLRQDRTGAARRAHRRGWKRLLPASAFDDQLKEIRAYNALIAASPDPAPVWQHVPEYFGTVATDCGTGIVTRRYRNSVGSWPRNLEQCLPRGLTPAMDQGLQVFARGVEQ
ncbi:MAG: YrbL family protein, partial [Chromatocurvus sp.]